MILLMEEFPKQPPVGCIKPGKQWDKLPTSTEAGFLNHQQYCHPKNHANLKISRFHLQGFCFFASTRRGPVGATLIWFLGFLDAVGLFISIGFTPTLHLLMRLLKLAGIFFLGLEHQRQNNTPFMCFCQKMKHFYLFLTIINSFNQTTLSHKSDHKNLRPSSVLILLGFLFQITFHVLLGFPN